MINDHKEEQRGIIPDVAAHMLDEDPPVIAMRNVRYVSSEEKARRKDTYRYLIWSAWMALVLLLGAVFLMMLGTGSVIHKSEITYITRGAAGIFILMVIVNFVAEFGWFGGDSNDPHHNRPPWSMW